MKPSKRQRRTKGKSKNLDKLENLKIEQCPVKRNQKSIPEQDHFQNSSEANWEIINSKRNNFETNNDKKSVYSNFSTESKKSMVGKLYKAVEILRNKMPQRSLQQIIIRLYQATQIKKDQSNQGSVFGDMSEFSTFRDMQQREEPKQFQVKKQADLLSNLGEERPVSDKNFNEIKKLSSQEGTQDEDQHPFQIKDKSIKRNEDFLQKTLDQHQKNYIYKPKGQQVVVEFLAKDTLKTKFVNIEEQTRYKDQRFVAQSFIHRGYGVCQCRKELEVQNKNIFMHRDTYKALSTSMMIFAFRKLESFISIECGKKIKFIDRHQMQSIYITLLNCRINMQPEYVITLMKYIKACYGLGDVVIGEIESVKLYLTCQKYLYGKNVTMQFLQKLGEIKHKKQIQQTLTYINNRSMRYQQRLITLRKTRKEKKLRQLTNQANTNNISNNGKSAHSFSSQQVKSQGRESQNSSNEQLKVEEIQLKQQQEQELDIGVVLAKEYIKNKELMECINQMKIKYVYFQAWTEENFLQLFYQLIKKALEKVQIQANIIRDSRVQWIKIAQNSLFDKLLIGHSSQILRVQILQYFLLSEPNLLRLKQVLSLVKSFVTTNQPCNQIQRQNQSQIISQNVTESIKYQRGTKKSQFKHSNQSFEGQDSLNNMIEESNLESQLQNLSAELFGDTFDNLASDFTGQTNENYLQTIESKKSNQQQKMQEEVNVQFQK